MASVLHAAWALMRDTAKAWIDDYAPSMGAALAYYTLFSTAPLLLIVISLAGLIFGEQAARGEIMGQISNLVGPQSAETIQTLLEGLNQPASGVWGSVVGLVVLLIGATTVFSELQNSMDRIWRAPCPPPNGGLMGLVKARLLALGLVMGIGFLLMVSLLVSTAVAALGKWWAPWFGQYVSLAHALDWLVSFSLITAIFAMIYKWVPQVKIAWRDVWIGAALTALLFTLGKSLIGLYIGRSGVASPFGAAASLVVLLLWVYYPLSGS
jgi:membrane protein